MYTLAIDPGAHPGYSIVDSADLIDRPRFCKRAFPRVVWLATRWVLPPNPNRISAVATEGQDPSAKRGSKAREEDILTLAATRGAQLYRACVEIGAPGYVLPVKTWKGVLLPGFGSADKAVYCNRIEAELTPEEMQLLAQFTGDRRLDVLDSIGINWALYALGYPVKYHWKEPP